MTNCEVIFLSGAGLDGWIWDDVIAGIADVPSVVVDYSAVRKNKNASLGDYVNAAAESVKRLKSDKVIIVAHSIGGIVGIELARELGDRVVGFVGISASVPIPGSNFFSCLPFPQKVIVPIIVRLVGTKPPEGAIRSGLASDLQGKVADRIVASFQPEAKGLYYGKTSTTDYPNLPYCYIRTTKDKELPSIVQDKISKQLPNATVHDIDSGHLAMLSHPAEVTGVINGFARSLNK